MSNRRRALQPAPPAPKVEPTDPVWLRWVRRRQRRNESMGRVLYRPAGWGAKHTRLQAERQTPPAPRTPGRQVLPMAPERRITLYLRRGATLTPRQRKAVLRAFNRLEKA